MNIKKTLFTLIAVLFILDCNLTWANENRSILWKISGNGLGKPSYLFGTHHLVPISFLENINGLQEAFDATEQTVGEIDLSNISEMQIKIIMAAKMPENVTYSSLLSESDLSLLDQTLIELLGVGLAQFGMMKPAMLHNIVTISLYQKYYPELSGAENIDTYFQQEAEKKNRPVIALETVDDQIEMLLHSQTIERQAEMLICTIQHPEILKEQMDEMHVAYHKQNLDALDAIYTKENPNDPCPSTQIEKDAMNKNRNDKWLKKLPQIMSEKSSFIAVGCLHLVGEDGLIEGLRELGYKVEAIK